MMWNLETAFDAVELVGRRRAITIDIKNGQAAVSLGSLHESTSAPDPARREEAAARIAAQLSTFIRKPSARRAWWSREGRDLTKHFASPADAYRFYLRQALIEKGATDVDRPQYIRIGPRWIKGRDGRRMKIRPLTLPLPELLRWLQQSADSEVVALAGSVPAVTAGASELVATASLRKRPARPKRGARTDEAETLLARGRLTRQQRQILTLAVQGWTDREIAAQLGIKDGTVRVHIRNARKSLSQRD